MGNGRDGSGSSHNPKEFCAISTDRLQQSQFLDTFSYTAVFYFYFPEPSRQTHKRPTTPNDMGPTSRSNIILRISIQKPKFTVGQGGMCSKPDEGLNVRNFQWQYYPAAGLENCKWKCQDGSAVVLILNIKDPGH